MPLTVAHAPTAAAIELVAERDEAGLRLDVLLCRRLPALSRARVRSMLDAGIFAAAGSDFSPGPFAVLMGIQGMVTRRGWDGKVWGANQRITVSEAIAVNTYNGAWASGEETIKGSITAGKLADYVVLADDLHTVDVEKIKDIQIVRTVVGGRTSYQA